MTHCPRRSLVLKLVFISAVLGLASGCTSALKAVTGTYSYYEVADGKVTYYRWNPMSMRYHARVLEQADPATFETIGTEHGKDATTVYEWDIPIHHADPATFKLLTANYARDATQIFYGRTRLEGADVTTFERLSDGWSRDSDDVYFGNKRLDVCDIDTFETLSMWQALDSQCYYIESEQITAIDRTSLQILRGGYARDRSQVYWLEHVVDGADPATFEVKEDQIHTLARDANQCFSGPRVVTCDALNPKGQAYCRC